MVCRNLPAACKKQPGRELEREGDHPHSVGRACKEGTTPKAASGTKKKLKTKKEGSHNLQGGPEPW